MFSALTLFPGTYWAFFLPVEVRPRSRESQRVTKFAIEPPGHVFCGEIPCGPCRPVLWNAHSREVRFVCQRNVKRAGPEIWATLIAFPSLTTKYVSGPPGRFGPCRFSRAFFAFGGGEKTAFRSRRGLTEEMLFSKRKNANICPHRQKLVQISSSTKVPHLCRGGNGRSEI